MWWLRAAWIFNKLGGSYLAKGGQVKSSVLPVV